jgi:hypothetical protein
MIKYRISTQSLAIPSQGLPTLFVVGNPEAAELMEVLKDHPDCQHIHFGADHSMPLLQFNDYEGWKLWEDYIMYFLDQNYNCVLELDVSCVAGLIEGGLIERHNFYPVVNVNIPYVNLLGYNAAVKIEDSDADRDHVRSWTHMLHDLQDRSKFTDIVTTKNVLS